MWSRRRSNLPDGPILSAEISTGDPPFVNGPPNTRGRRGLGIRYEQLVHQEFVARYAGYVPSLWFRYWDRAGEKWCQPDGLIINPWQRSITIIECKYTHTNDAYVQLFKLYRPVVTALFGGLYTITCCEVVKWFDPAILCDVEPRLCRLPELAPVGVFNVHIYKP